MTNTIKLAMSPELERALKALEDRFLEGANVMQNFPDPEKIKAPEGAIPPGYARLAFDAKAGAHRTLATLGLPLPVKVNAVSMAARADIAAILNAFSPGMWQVAALMLIKIDPLIGDACVVAGDADLSGAVRDLVQAHMPLKVLKRAKKKWDKIKRHGAKDKQRWNAEATKTGRWTSHAPNLQNFQPSKDIQDIVRRR